VSNLVSVVIPTLNEAVALGPTLGAVARMHGPIEVIVADARSLDGTVDIARAHGARLVTSERGRGAQMHAGAAAARGEAIWFLHADTQPPVNGAESVLNALSDSAVVGGNFAIRFDGARTPARFLTWLYPKLSKLGLMYGDSGIFVRKAVYQAVGGFRPYPLFEDLDLIERLRRHGRLAHVPVPVVTSSRRFENRSFALTFAQYTALQILYWAGAPPRVLHRFYADIRGRF
jgi:rSAM/selenodomain-associated transferase 2